MLIRTIKEGGTIYVDTEVLQVLKVWPSGTAIVKWRGGEILLTQDEWNILKQDTKLTISKDRSPRDHEARLVFDAPQEVRIWQPPQEEEESDISNVE